MRLVRHYLIVVAIACVAALLQDVGEASARENAHHAIPDIAVAALPPEAQQTLQTIKRGGPFYYTRDGAVFGNHERRLPLRSHDYYREYTVPTPGTTNRGARRMVSGRGGEYYFSDDHYRTFKRVRE